MNEYVEKEEVLDRLYEEGELTEAISHTVYAMDAADVTPVVHGRWIGRYDHAVKVGWKCSICGCLIFHERDKSNYCPFCGARMDGGADRD